MSTQNEQPEQANEPLNGAYNPEPNGRNGYHGHQELRQVKDGPAFIAPTPPRYAQIVGWGYHVPSKVITNRDLEQIVDTQDEWIRSRTGIEERHVAGSPQETSATLGIQAARKALDLADIHPNKIDLIICATSSPEHIFPATASLIQDGLGAKNAGAFDLSAACSGFVYGLSMARGHILAGDAEYVLVIGAETLSRIVDWTDRGTCVLFGDGAGAVLVAASDVPGGIMASVLGSDGSGADLLTVPAGGSAMPATLETVSNGSHYIKMDGRAVFRFATRVMAEATTKVLAKAGLTVQDVDLVIPHQANERIIQNSVLKQLQIPSEKVFVNLQKYGNTSTASIPIALCEAIEAGKVKPGDKLVFVGFGAGLTWGACAIEWRTPVEKQEATWWRNTQRQATYQAAAARSMWKRAIRRVYSQVLSTREDEATS
ncbi:MAG: ketoacyl-ACP synthase III [Caldilineaceae bacterium]|nr:ketoacyl-ACP synthase III [Caldilineaceae bacterium]